ncbi:molybdopterin converting factor small subunit [Rhodococcus rhodnii LMG 5362]|uniref:Molybdopterin converting factor small subunit n=1 Tax=Rhodococcus rhodnii LMG 5362 TaxID=1273125 RepID=R7WQK6_9NOCA|nr:molybdopterin converting factor small subunit [Rhodococcus rhodnii LMG 5362]
MQVRYFAAASDAAGCVKETLDLPAGASLADLESVIVERHGDRMRRVLSVAAFLVEDDLTRDRTVLAGPAVDVLPPFAGG